MRVIDIHAHIFPDHVAATAMPALEEEANTKAFFDGTRAGLITEMDRAGIDRAVIQPVATKPTQVAGVNDWAAAETSERIVPFGAMHPDVPDPASEMERMAILGLRGFKMHPEYQECAPDDPRMTPVLEGAIEHEMVVLFHAGADIGIPTLRGTPRAFARMLDLYPGLTAILAHMGGFDQWDAVREHLVGRDVYFDTSYTLGHLPDREFKDLVRAHGAERIVFGTDGPWTDMKTELEGILALGLTDTELETILERNAERLLHEQP